MGIKGINPLLKKHAPDAFFTIPISDLTGKRVAIDANNWMYTNMATARKKIINRTDVSQQEPNQVEIRREWFLSAINFIMKWLEHNITPVFVFDGQHLPEKDETKCKRRDARSASRIKIEALYAQLRNENLERPTDIIDELRKELRNYNYISTEDFELFKMVIKGIGIPCLQAVADGEQLCSMLCVDGKVAAVFSADTDNLTYGCPLIISGFGDAYSYDQYGNRILNLECVRYDRVLAGLNVAHSFFVDLCIMCGCDFNTNMTGYAATKSLGLLRKYGSIDKLPRDLNTQCLKHVRCREIFKYVSSDDLITKICEDDNEYEDSPKFHDVGPLDINKEAIATARDYLEMVGVSGQIERIITAYQQMKVGQYGYVENLQLSPPPKYVPPVREVILNISKPPIRFITLKVVS